jgi:hypothetical protein
LAFTSGGRTLKQGSDLAESFAELLFGCHSYKQLLCRAAPDTAAGRVMGIGVNCRYAWWRRRLRLRFSTFEAY